jgi:hypothetical protein
MLGTTAGSFLVCCVLGLVPCRVRVTPYFFFTRILTTGFLIALSFQAGNTAYLYLSGDWQSSRQQQPAGSVHCIPCSSPLS